MFNGHICRQHSKLVVQTISSPTFVNNINLVTNACYSELVRISHRHVKFKGVSKTSGLEPCRSTLTALNLVRVTDFWTAQVKSGWVNFLHQLHIDLHQFDLEEDFFAPPSFLYWNVFVTFTIIVALECPLELV